MSEAVRRFVAVGVLFITLTLVATWPQVVRPEGIPPHRDSWFNMWRIAWIAHQLPRDPAHLFDANIYYPERGTLAYSDATLLEGILASPLIWLRVPTPYVYTLLVLGSFVFAGLSMWTLVRRLTGNDAAGVAAGLIFAFAPYRFDHYMHLELLWSGWMPLALLALHQVIERPTLRAGIATGLLFVAQTLSCIYYGIFFGTVLVPIAVVLAGGLRGRALRHVAVALTCGAIVGGVLLSFYFPPYQRARGAVGERLESEVLLYSGGPRHYLAATPDNFIYGALMGGLGRHEKYLFPGFLASILAAAALSRPLSRRAVAYAIALLLAIDLSFGPNGLTYEWLRDHVFPYRGLRVPARAGCIALLSIAVLAGLGWAQLARSTRLGGLFRNRWAVGLLLTAIALEYATRPRALIPAPVKPEPIYEWLAAQTAPGALIELPMPHDHWLPGYDAEFAYRSTWHWRALVNGYSGNVPVSYVEVMRAVSEFPTDAAIDRLRRVGVRYVIIHERLFQSRRYSEITTSLNARRDVTRQVAFGPPGDESAAYVVRDGVFHD